MSERVQRARVLLVTRNLPPLIGGMERLNWHLSQELAKSVDLRVIGPKGSAPLAPAGIEVTEVPLRPLGRFLLAAQLAALAQARRWKPDAVLAGSGLAALATLVSARAVGARAVAYVHGLDLTVKHPLYRALWLPALRRMDRVIANSGPTADLAAGVGISPARLGVVPPGVQTRPPPVPAQAIAGFRRAQHLGDRPVLLSVGRLTERKGIREFVAQALPAIVARVPDALLVVVGGVPKEALRAGSQSPDSIRETAVGAGVGDNVRLLGQVDDATLAAAYATARVHVFPIRALQDDPEGFGMVAVEAAAHGLQTIAFAVGGVTDAVAEDVNGHLLPPGDYAGFARAVVDALLVPDHGKSSEAQAFADRFGWETFGERIREQLARVVPVR